MIGEGISNNTSEGNVESSPAESGATTYWNLGEQVKFDPDRAERLQNGENLDETSQSDEVVDIPVNAVENTPDNDGEPESLGEEQTVEREEINHEQQEKSRAEQRLDTAKERLEKIDQELLDANSNKEKLEEEIAACEVALDDNMEQYNKLSDKVNELKLEIKKTKRNVLTGFTSGLRIAKNLMLGKHDEARKILGEISNNVDANEKAMTEHEETQVALDANENEKAVLDDAYANAVDERNNCISKIARLERQKAEAIKQVETLKEEVANEAWTEAWKDAQEGIKAEMGTDNMNAFRRKLNIQKKELDENLEEDLTELDTFRNPSRIQRMMRTEEELQRDAERADEVEGMLREEHGNATAIIAAKREKVDRYFPTWQERVKNIRENNLVRGALSTLKRRVMMRMYGLA